jgi:hypothetical protein
VALVTMHLHLGRENNIACCIGQFTR